jgi:hypothetical protein
LGIELRRRILDVGVERADVVWMWFSFLPCLLERSLAMR